MGYLGGFLVTLRQRGRKNRNTLQYAKDEGGKREKPVRLHGRHVLNRYEDGMEKCIGCELCAGVCPAKCIYVRGADNDPDDPTSPGERFGFIYEINYLRCIHCDLCVEACPTGAITFGDVNAPGSQVAALAAHPRAMKLLEALNVKPSVSYLTKVRNDKA